MEQYTSPAIAGALVAVLSFCIQFGMFARPVDLERKHREILDDCERRFASLNTVNDLKEQFKEIKEKIDKIYDCVISQKCE